MPSVNLIQKAHRIVATLRRLYPNAHCELAFSNPMELAFATILSAQCTDKRVNQVTPALFKKYRSARDYAQADINEIESLIRPTGFFRSKALSIQESAKTLVKNFNGEIPKTMRELLTLRGVARKTANVILGTAFKIADGVVVDTHVQRISRRLGLTRKNDPVSIEKDLISLIPKKDWIFFGHAMVWHGRRTCKAQTPDCPHCRLKPLCLYASKQ